ncbi:hypothetical protein [Streptomyces sp. RerS4]|uniref:hypothetical protein n=1 Tax=Streptomyces sp. RerS4 TaxID=2942449 RepID=UPI00201C65B9|nr:hypothetical protein [Streptomyces sp. RerS4]UQX03418.1 hypothetical protein M4D82_25235 [Streptomyces sp. RerS4]
MRVPLMADEAAEGCDVLVASGLMPAGARSVAEKPGIRYVYAGFHPFEMPSAHYLPSPRPNPPAPPGTTDNQALRDLDARKANALYLQSPNAHRTTIGLAPVGGGAPQVVVAQFVDQRHRAARVAEPGIGAAHDDPTPTCASLSTALRAALAPETKARPKAVAGTIRTEGRR